MNTLTFKGNKGMTGNISTDAGTHKITFSKGGLKGDLKISVRDDKWGNQNKNDVTFEKNATLEGNISAEHHKWNSTSAQNTINFKKGGKIKGTLYAISMRGNYNTSNNITFGDSSSTNGKGEIEGKISVVRASTKLVFNTKDNSIKGSITSDNYAKTSITGSNQEGSSLKITGDVVTKYNSQLTITANKSDLTFSNITTKSASKLNITGKSNI